MMRKIMLHDREIKYTVKQSRRARHLRIAVYCDASVVVTTPTFFGEYYVERFLKAKAGWVLAKLDHFFRLGLVARPKYSHRGRREYLKYREQARALVYEKIEKINQVYNFSFGRVAIKNHRSCWGSCSKKGNLNFNYKIIFLPERLAEYIVAHELCHLREFNHSKNFWNLVSRIFSDYKEIRKQIKKLNV